MNKELGKDGYRLKIIWQQGLSVTVKYPEMVAEKYPHFESNNIPDFG